MKDIENPAWQATLAAIVNHAEGDIISHNEINTILNLSEPDYADYNDQARFKQAMQAYAFLRLTLIEQLKHDLLVTHQCYIKSVYGEGYRIVPASDQTKTAYKVAVRNIHDEFEQGALIMDNVRQTALNAEEKKRANDMRAKFSILQRIFENNKKL